jgi:DNA-binding XRE family transcriptional regulator
LPLVKGVWKITLQEVFASRVAKLRACKAVTQEELGAVLELSRFAVGDMEKGKRLTTMEHLLTLADYFGVSVDYLMGRTDVPEVNHNR